MPPASARVAITLPTNLYRALEVARRKNGRSRSAIVQHALSHWLKEQQEEREKVRAYVEGYRKHPETDEEVESAMAAAVELFKTIEW